MKRRRKNAARVLFGVAIGSTIASSAFASPSTTSIQQGFDQGQMESARGVAMGDALMATGTSTTALYMNPANLAVASVYDFEALAAFMPAARRQTYGGAVADSHTSKLAGGIAGTWNELDPDGIHRSWADVRLTLAYMLSDYVSLGITGRYLRMDQSIGVGPLGQSLVSDGAATSPIFNTFTFDAGASVKIVDGLHIGAVGHNLTNTGTAVAPLTFGGGIGYTTPLFTLEGDVLADFSTWESTRERFMAGGEYFAGGHFPIRIGYRYDNGSRVQSISGGLGYVDRQWGLDASFRQDVAADHPDTLFMISIRYFMTSSLDPTGDITMSPDGF